MCEVSFFVFEALVGSGEKESIPLLCGCYAGLSARWACSPIISTTGYALSRHLYATVRAAVLTLIGGCANKIVSIARPAVCANMAFALVLCTSTPAPSTRDLALCEVSFFCFGTLVGRGEKESETLLCGCYAGLSASELINIRLCLLHKKRGLSNKCIG